VLRDGRKALRGGASVARRALEKADKADKALKRPGNYGYRKTGRATVVARLWRQAEQSFDAWGQEERAWQRVAAALTMFRGDGSLPTRARAEAYVAAALPDLAVPRWAKVRRALFFDLVEIGEEREVEGRAMFGVTSMGTFFAMAPADQVRELK